MKRIIIASLLFVISYSLSAQNWSQLNFSGQTNIHACSFSPIHPDKGWFVGYYFNAAFDFIPFGYSTNDGGTTLNYRSLTSSGILKAEDIYFKDDNIGLIAGMGITKTYDGGANWISIVDGISMRGTANDLYCSNEDIYAVGQRYDFGYQFFEGFIYKSTDGGTTFSDFTISLDASNQNSDIRAIFSTGNGVCYAGANNSLGTGNTLFKSTDDGMTWNEMNFSNSINSLFFTSVNVGFSATDIGLLKTTDAGLTWSNILSTAQSLNSIKIKDQFGLAVGDGGIIYKSVDGGDSWTQMTSPVTFSLHKVTIVSNTLAYATGPGGAIKYEVLTGIEDQSVTVSSCMLDQNYPNPFNPRTVISYQLPVANKVTLKLFDALGTEIATLVNEEKVAGVHKVEFNAIELASGIYFYKLQAGSFIETKKMMLLK